MFRVSSSEVQPRVPRSVALVLIALILASAMCVAAVFQVLSEHRLLGAWVERAQPVPISDVVDLREEIRTRIIIRSAASVIVLICTCATLWIQQRQLAVRRTLFQIRLMANNILANLDTGIITTDKQATIRSINSAAIHLLGIDFDCVGQPISHISSPEIPLDSMCRQIAAHEPKVADREFSLKRESRVRRVVTNVIVLKDTEGKSQGCLIHLRDVTERMMMLERVWRMEQFASLSTLAAGLHHEIKNPITALSIHVQLLDEKLTGTGADAQTSELLSIIKSEIRRLSILLDTFRNFANLERLNLKSVDLRTIVESVGRFIRPQASRQAVDLHLSYPDSKLPNVEVDPDKIEQALLNLVLNALEAMPSGGKLSLEVDLEGATIRIRVRDTGPGIHPDVQSHVFRPYFSTKGNGTGIGLTLAEKLVRQHGGDLDFRTSGNGTCFEMRFVVEAQARDLILT